MRNFYIQIVAFVALFCLVFACTKTEEEPEGRYLYKIDGISLCESNKKVSRGNQGTHLFKVFAVDNRDGHIDPLFLKEFKQDLQEELHLQISKARPPTLLDLNSGKTIGPAKVELSIDKTHGIKPIPSPNAQALQTSTGNYTLPKTYQIAIDTSKDSQKRDLFGSRFQSLLSWNKGGESTVGPLHTHLLASLGQNQFFRFYDQSGISHFAETIGKIRKNPEGGDLSIFHSVNGLTDDLLKYIFLELSSHTSRLYCLPASIAIVTSPDRELMLGDHKLYLEFAIKNLQKKHNGHVDIPFFGITFPRPKEVSPKLWEKHLDSLCSLARASGKNDSQTNGASNGWGEVFQLRENIGGEFKAQIKRFLHMSEYAMEGYTSIQLNYKVTGVASGRYLVMFSLDGTYLRLATKPENAPRLYFEVIIP